MVPAVQKIFYGPPGTGKTWRATREAVRAVRPDRYEEILAGPDADVRLEDVHKQLVNEGRIIWVTFHPSYTYEDFVEGFRPEIDDESGALIYRVIDGPLKRACSRVLMEGDLRVGDQLLDGNGKPAGFVVDKDAGGWLIKIRPERADEVAAEQYKYVSRMILERFTKAKLPPSVFSIPGKALVSLSDYSISPTDEDVPPPDPDRGEDQNMRNGGTVRRIVGARAQVSSSDLANSSHYGAAYRKLLQMQGLGGSRAGAIVIDEINRADLSRVFGELVTLLDPDKREGMPQEKRILLPHSKEVLSLPQDVSIIGTMNTVDRSVFKLEYAMHRRFELILVGAEPSMCPSRYAGVNLQRVCDRINRRISVLLSPDHQLGHAPLMEGALNRVANQQGWPGAPESQLRALAHVWRTYVIPTLHEYFERDWRKTAAVAGRVDAGGESLNLFDRILPDAALIEMLSENEEVADAISFRLAEWWNPHNAEWNPEKFRRLLNGLE